MLPDCSNFIKSFNTQYFVVNQYSRLTIYSLFQGAYWSLPPIHFFHQVQKNFMLRSQSSILKLARENNSLTCTRISSVTPLRYALDLPTNWIMKPVQKSNF